jgi:hypothetical protein
MTSPNHVQVYRKTVAAGVPAEVGIMVTVEPSIQSTLDEAEKE